MATRLFLKSTVQIYSEQKEVLKIVKIIIKQICTSMHEDNSV